MDVTFYPNYNNILPIKINRQYNKDDGNVNTMAPRAAAMF